MLIRSVQERRIIGPSTQIGFTPTCPSMISMGEGLPFTTTAKWLYPVELSTATGSLSVVLEDIVLAALAEAPASGVVAITLDQVVLAALAEAPASGVLSLSLDALTLAALAEAPASGALAISLDAIALSAIATTLMREPYVFVLLPAGRARLTLAPATKTRLVLVACQRARLTGRHS